MNTSLVLEIISSFTKGNLFKKLTLQKKKNETITLTIESLILDVRISLSYNKRVGLSYI